MWHRSNPNDGDGEDQRNLFRIAKLRTREMGVALAPL